MNIIMYLRHFLVFSPAGAGVILSDALGTVMADGFPRRCGGDPPIDIKDVKCGKFSPQVRG